MSRIVKAFSWCLINPVGEPKNTGQPSTTTTPPPPPPPPRDVDHSTSTIIQTQPSSSTPTTQPQPEEDGFPKLDLLDYGQRDQFIKTCVPLFDAAMKGDWEAAQTILNANQHMVRYAITENYETALHVAASGQGNAESVKFVDQLVTMMHKNDLKLKNINGNTALCTVAAAGNVKIAEIMVAKNKKLLTTPNTTKMMPLYIATIYENQDMVNYLYNESQQFEEWTSEQKDMLLLKCVDHDRFDIALKVLENHSEFNRYRRILGILAQKPNAFDEIKLNPIKRIIKSILCSNVGHATHENEALQLLKKIWAKVVTKKKNEIDEILRGPVTMIDGKETYPSRVLFVAAKMGNTKFIVELIRTYPDLLWKMNDHKQSIFHVAISHRQESVYGLLHEIGSMKGWVTPLEDLDKNNMLHLVGMYTKKTRLHDVSGVAFQMQRELLWFKEVESMILPHYREQKNNDGLTPYELFTENHKDLASESEKWMKGTASKCMVVAALIATVVFGAAYTIPGGYIQEKDNGFPVFLNHGLFIAFVVFDAISLILSTTSILMFLSILTSRYEQNDFLESLPRKLMAGLLTLFLSIFTMMVAFSFSLFVLYRHKFIAIPIVITVSALIPIFVYGKLQYPLLMDVFHSTRHSRDRFKPKKGLLYYQNPRV